MNTGFEQENEKNGWLKADSLLSQIEIIGNAENDLVSIEGKTEGLECIGVGTDAAVFVMPDLPQYAFKVYSQQALSKKNIEKEVYDKLKGSPYFATCYGDGNNYLVLSFEDGPTLQDCLTLGVPVPEQVILDVEDARRYVRSVGLNPRDIHLKNVLNQNGRGKVLDVSEYVKDGDDQRWDHLVWAYYNVYPRFNEIKVPAWVMESVKKWYNRRYKPSMNLEDFSSRIVRLFNKLMK
ncbi:serine/threonine protein kinase [Neobacillus mesonae]|nr:serine/threonine protein kinase [Neobacillus mesonae]